MKGKSADLNNIIQVEVDCNDVQSPQQFLESASVEGIFTTTHRWLERANDWGSSTRNQSWDNIRKKNNSGILGTRAGTAYQRLAPASHQAEEGQVLLNRQKYHVVRCDWSIWWGVYSNHSASKDSRQVWQLNWKGRNEAETWRHPETTLPLHATINKCLSTPTYAIFTNVQLWSRQVFEPRLNNLWTRDFLRKDLIIFNYKVDYFGRL